MVGGQVIEVAEVQDRPDRLFVDVVDRTHSKETCAIYVEKNETSLRIEIGDSLWWQGGSAMWTPQANLSKPWDSLRGGVDYDIRIPRIGYSGVEHPSRKPQHDAPAGS